MPSLLRSCAFVYLIDMVTQKQKNRRLLKRVSPIYISVPTILLPDTYFHWWWHIVVCSSIFKTYGCKDDVHRVTYNVYTIYSKNCNKTLEYLLYRDFFHHAGKSYLIYTIWIYCKSFSRSWFSLKKLGSTFILHYDSQRISRHGLGIQYCNSFKYSNVVLTRIFFLL